jgi:hypothetical protein
MQNLGMLDTRYVESGAYHEAGHAVVAAVQGMPLRDRGIHCDELGAGITYYWFKVPNRAKNVGPEIERERTIVATCAGLIAQQKFYPGCPTSGAVDDFNLVLTLLNEMYPDGDVWFAAREKLHSDSVELVGRHWSAISTLAATLWGKPWTLRQPGEERDWSSTAHEKKMDGSEVVEVLKRCGIPAFVVTDAAASYTPPPGQRADWVFEHPVVPVQTKMP